MPKKITARTDKAPQGWRTNEEPYLAVMWRLTQGKTEEEAQKIKEEFEESHTYLFICEYGNWCPTAEELLIFYKAEQENGLYGFVRAIMEDMPAFFLDRYE